MGLKKKITISLIIVVLILFVVLPIYIANSSIHPERCTYTQTPKDYNMNYKEEKITTPDGVGLDVWISVPDKTTSNNLFIIMHGYTSCKSSPGILKIANAIYNRGYVVILFDFRAHGTSGGETTTIGPKETIDANTIIRYVSELFPDYKINLIGYSMGAAVAIVVASNNTLVNSVIADSPYYRLEEVIPRWIESMTPFPAWYGKLVGIYGKMMTRTDLNFGPSNIQSIDKPLTIFYGTEDPLVTLEEIQDIAGKSPCGKIVVGEGAGHVRTVDVIGINHYIDIIVETANKKCG